MKTQKIRIGAPMSMMLFSAQSPLTAKASESEPEESAAGVTQKDKRRPLAPEVEGENTLEQFPNEKQREEPA